MTDHNQLLFSYLVSSLKLGSGTEKGQTSLGYGHKILIKIGKYFEEDIQKIYIMSKK